MYIYIYIYIYICMKMYKYEKTQSLQRMILFFVNIKTLNLHLAI